MNQPKTNALPPQLQQEQLPDWGLWLARDADGSWWLYEAEPHIHEHGWYENEVGRSIKVLQAEAGDDWPQSLTQLKRKN